MNARIRFDFTNYSSEMVGEHGISDEAILSLTDRAHTITRDMRMKRENGFLPYRNLPYTNVDDIISYGSDIRDSFENFVNVGIGGSALGAQALFNALCHPMHNLLEDRPGNGLRMFFADNIDPDYMNGIFDVCAPKKTIFNIITKSGSTAETMSTFLLVRELLEKRLGSNWSKNIVITTDAAKGDLRAIADKEQITSFVVPDGVGGRFSVMTAVGLIPAAAAGIDIRALLDGAAFMDTWIEEAKFIDNPAYLYAAYQYLFDCKQDKRISVMMPYCSGLYSVADWFRQLWAESLGKKHALDGSVVNVGPTPVKALGVTDQHSQVQLYVEGPYDKVFTLLAVETFNHTLPMKTAYEGTASLDYLGGRTMAELMEAERLGTVYALTNNNRPNMTVTFPEVNAHTVGQFLYALEAATVFSGGLYGIDPLDQPGVEGGKIAAFALMGRPGYEERAEEIRSGLKSVKNHVKG